MKKIAIAMVAAIAFAGTAFAADVISLPAKNGNVSFHSQEAPGGAEGLQGMP